MGQFRALHDLTRGDDEGDANRRRAGRIAIEGVRNSEGEVYDLSSTGARIQTRRRWKVGETHPVVFECDAGENALMLQARCVWVRKVSMFRRMVGVEFVDLAPEQQKTLTNLATRSAKRAWCGLRHSNDVDWDKLESLERAAAKADPSPPADRAA
jgi:hypothetical protein